MQREERNARGEVPPLPKEPLPHVTTAVWKKWLLRMWEHPWSEGKFTFDGVPFICNGYLNVHVDAMKVLLALLPHSKKMHMVAIHGPLRDTFLRAVAMLLCVHGLYEETVTCLQITIAPNR